MKLLLICFLGMIATVLLTLTTVNFSTKFSDQRERTMLFRAVARLVGGCAALGLASSISTDSSNTAFKRHSRWWWS